MITTIKLRRDLKKNWETKNPVLAEGEIGLILDSPDGEYKIGDGKTNWKTLKVRGSDEVVINDTGTFPTNNSDIYIDSRDDVTFNDIVPMVPEAPMDDKMYVRMNGEWVEIPFNNN